MMSSALITHEAPSCCVRSGLWPHLVILRRNSMQQRCHRWLQCVNVLQKPKCDREVRQGISNMSALSVTLSFLSSHFPWSCLHLAPLVTGVCCLISLFWRHLKQWRVFLKCDAFPKGNHMLKKIAHADLRPICFFHRNLPSKLSECFISTSAHISPSLKILDSRRRARIPPLSLTDDM